MLRPLRKERRQSEDRAEPSAVGRHDEGPREPLRQLGPESIGQVLQRTRVKYGQDLRQAAQALRIRYSYLEAIEEGRHDDLPGLAYAVGFVRSYADYLGLDPQDIVRRYKDEATGLDRKPHLHMPLPVSEAKVPTGTIILVSLLLAGLAYLGWTYASRETEAPPSLAEAPPSASDTSASSEPLPAPPAPTATAPAAAALAEGEPTSMPAAPPQTSASTTDGGLTSSTPAVTSAPVPQPGTVPDTSLGGPLTAPLVQPGQASASAAEPQPGEKAEAEGYVPAADGEELSAAPPAPPQTAATPEAAGPAARIVLRATQDSWVQIRDAKDAAILTRVLREGESYDVPDEQGLTLLTGNAGGLTIEVDGKTLPSLGTPGQVKRDIPLAPDMLLQGLQ